jgi:UPF0755 protein
MPARIAAAVLLGILGLTLTVFYYSMEGDSGRVFEGVVLEIPRGTGTMAALRLLQDKGLIRNRWTALTFLKFFRAGKPLQAGEYEFNGTPGPGRVLEKILRGEVRLHAVTFPEGRTSFEYARVLEQAGICPTQEFLAAARETDLARPLRVTADTLEGFLFPDTYRFPKGFPARNVVRTFLGRFRVMHAGLEDELRRQALDPQAWVTLASIVEREAKVPAEKPIIAGVFFNRLAIGMSLQADPTVLYALERRGTPVDVLTRADLRLDSRYNTYRYAGLPPGPIGNPGREALEAVLHPRSHRYLYFVARADGTHAFAATLDAHVRNVLRCRRAD